MVVQNMWRTYEKYVFFRKKIGFDDSFDITKCLQRLPDVYDQDICDQDVCDPDVCDLDVCDHLVTDRKHSINIMHTCFMTGYIFVLDIC